MKELSFEKMEGLNGGVLKAGCAVAGVVTGVSLFFAWTGAGAAFFWWCSIGFCSNGMF